MGKHEGKSKSGLYKAVLITIILVVILVAFVFFALPQILSFVNGDNEYNNSDQASDSGKNDDVSTSIEPIQFPVLIEDGKIEITSVFQFDGINPDCGKEDGENIAAILLKNLSDSYLDTATVNIILADGKEHTFLVQDLPPEKSVMAFSVDNLPLSTGYVCAEVYADCRFDQTKKDDRIDISVNLTSITLTNVTDEDLFDVVVYCHDVFDEKYFGGITYMYTVDKIPAGESTTITASDSLMGVIDVVQIAVDN